MTRPLIVDTFCKAGGAAWGYYRAGFDVLGVDIEPQPNYPFDFVQADALDWLAHPGSLRGVAAIHASPPCQAYSAARSLPNAGTHPQLVEPTRALLQASGLPWIIENVPGAPLRADVTLCGSNFRLGAACRDGVWRQLRRHRLFELSWGTLALVPQCNHVGQPVGVYGYGGGGQYQRGYKAHPGEDAAALGIGWMTRRELAQAIPPAYTEWVGGRLMIELGRA